MKVTIELPPDIEAGVHAQAQVQGLDVSAYVQNLVREQVTAIASRPACKLRPEEWVRHFTAWSEGPAHANLPDLSDEATSRESIYSDRGL